MSTLLAADPGPDVMAALARIDAASLGELDQLLLVEAVEKQHGWLAALAVSAMGAVCGANPVDADDFVREDVRAALHLSRPAAQDRIDVARTLRTCLVATHNALRAGQIGYQHVRALVEAVVDRAPDVARTVESRVLDRARSTTVAEFRRTVARQLLIADPRSAEEQHAAAVRDRSVRTWPLPEGMAAVHAELSAQDARTVWLALEALAAAGLPVEPGIERESVDARRADALTALCAGALADPTLPRRHGRPASVQVVVDLPTLLGLADHPGHLQGYGPVTAGVARALAADGIWQRFVVEPVTGHLLDLGSTRYRPNQHLADYVLARSPVCTFPPCHTPSSASEIDHGVPWDPGSATGGSTSARNLAPACKRHHQLKTHGGWNTTRHDDGSTSWTSASGRIHHAPAHDHRPDRR